MVLQERPDGETREEQRDRLIDEDREILDALDE